MEDEIFKKEKEAAEKFSQKYSDISGFPLNPDMDVRNTVIEGLARNKLKYGVRYCPCRRVEGKPEEDRKKICPCFWHKEEIERDGHCHCVLFFKKK